MSEERLEQLKQEFKMRAEKEITERRRDIEATIALLQAILNKPANGCISLSLDPETQNAEWEKYQYEKSASGIGHSRIAGTYSGMKLSYHYATKLDSFLESVELNDCYEIGLPVIETKEALIAAAEKKLEEAKRYRDGSAANLVRYEKLVPEYEAVLKELQGEANGKPSS